MDIALNELPILKKIDELKAEIDSLRPLNKDQEERIMQKFRLDWNYHSNAIEGNSLDFGETHAFLMYGLTAKGKPFKDYLDVRGHNDAINYLMSLVQSQEIITEKDIRGLHEILLIEPYDSSAQTPEGLAITKRIHLGEYKKLPNSVKTITGEMHYYTAPEDTVHEMGKLMDWYKETMETKSLNPIVFAALFHHKFVSIHPFDDGNGRMSRLLMNLILMKFQYPPVIIKETLKSEYYLQLSQADTGKVGPFVEFIAVQMINSMNIYIKGANGDNLEDPNDLDMKLALFKKELDGQPDKVEVKKSQEVLLEIYSSSIKPFINELRLTLLKFHEFFIGYKEGTIMSIVNSENNSEWHYSEIDIDNHLSNYFDSESIDPIILYFLFEDFKTKENSFSIEVKLIIFFNQFSYVIFLSPSAPYELSEYYNINILNWLPQLRIEKVYHQNFTINEIKNICHELGNDLYEKMIQFHKKEKISLDKILNDKLNEYWDSFKNQYINPDLVQYAYNIEKLVIEGEIIKLFVNYNFRQYQKDPEEYIKLSSSFAYYLKRKIKKHDILYITVHGWGDDELPF